MVQYITLYQFDQLLQLMLETFPYYENELNLLRENSVVLFTEVTNIAYMFMSHNESNVVCNNYMFADAWPSFDEFICI